MTTDLGPGITRRRLTEHETKLRLLHLMGYTNSQERGRFISKFTAASQISQHHIRDSSVEQLKEILVLAKREQIDSLISKLSEDIRKTEDV